MKEGGWKLRHVDVLKSDAIPALAEEFHHDP